MSSSTPQWNNGWRHRWNLTCNLNVYSNILRNLLHPNQTHCVNFPSSPVDEG